MTKEKTSLEKAKNKSMHENSQLTKKIKSLIKNLEQSKSDLEKKVKVNQALQI